MCGGGGDGLDGGVSGDGLDGSVSGDGLDGSVSGDGLDGSVSGDGLDVVMDWDDGNDSSLVLLSLSTKRQFIDFTFFLSN